MEPLSSLLAFCEGKPPVYGGLLSQRLVMQCICFFVVNLNKLKQTADLPLIWEAVHVMLRFSVSQTIFRANYDNTMCGDALAPALESPR